MALDMIISRTSDHSWWQAARDTFRLLENNSEGYFRIGHQFIEEKVGYVSGYQGRCSLKKELIFLKGIKWVPGRKVENIPAMAVTSTKKSGSITNALGLGNPFLVHLLLPRRLTVTGNPKTARISRMELSKFSFLSARL
ncbi:MAG: hypothetical protein R2784_09180 [Saprospiraceae bacterium]